MNFISLFVDFKIRVVWSIHYKSEILNVVLVRGNILNMNIMTRVYTTAIILVNIRASNVSIY